MGCLSVPRTARSGHQGSSLSRKSLFLCQDNGADSEQVRYAKRECDFFDFFKRSRNNVAYRCVQCGCSSFGFSLKAKLDPGQQSLPKRLAARAALRSVPSWRPRDLTRRPRIGNNSVLACVAFRSAPTCCPRARRDTSRVENKRALQRLSPRAFACTSYL